MRLFVAIWPPAHVLDDLHAALTGVHDSAPSLRWTTREQWHLTLAFLGEVADQARPELERRLARVAQRHPPLTLQLKSAGRFGHRVLFVKLAGDVQALGQLAASTGAAARRSGIEVEDRPYRPHLTLARGPRDGEDLRPLAERLATFESPPWTATAIDLVQSRLGQGPGRRAAYSTVAIWPLTG